MTDSGRYFSDRAVKGAMASAVLPALVTAVLGVAATTRSVPPDMRRSSSPARRRCC